MEHDISNEVSSLPVVQDDTNNTSSRTGLIAGGVVTLGVVVGYFAYRFLKGRKAQKEEATPAGVQAQA